MSQLITDLTNGDPIMANRPKIPPELVINAGSMAGNLISAPTIIQSISMPCYQLSWSGTSPVGTVSVQVSNDFSLNPDGTVKNAGNWDSLYLVVGSAAPAQTIAISGNTGHGFIDVPLTGAYACRLIYTAGSGTGTLNVTFSAKVT